MNFLVDVATAGRSTRPTHDGARSLAVHALCDHGPERSAGRRRSPSGATCGDGSRQNIPAMASLVLLVLFALPWPSLPHVPTRPCDQADLLATDQLPILRHWFGTDALGRDLWLSVWFGARVRSPSGSRAALAQMVHRRLIGCLRVSNCGRVRHGPSGASSHHDR